jgi:hypothetical protein
MQMLPGKLEASTAVQYVPWGPVSRWLQHLFIAYALAYNTLRVLDCLTDRHVEGACCHQSCVSPGVSASHNLFKQPVQTPGGGDPCGRSCGALCAPG